jgi:hypothetical protein
MWFRGGGRLGGSFVGSRLGLRLGSLALGMSIDARLFFRSLMLHFDHLMTIETDGGRFLQAVGDRIPVQSTKGLHLSADEFQVD